MTRLYHTKDIFNNIISAYNRLTKSEIKVADFILQNKQQVHLMSISELALSCDVSEATVSRFCHTVGCSSYNEFKLAAVQALSGADPLDMGNDLYSNILHNDSLEQKIRKLCNISTHALLQTQRQMDVEAISKAVDMLVNARGVYCFGQGNSSIVAEDTWGRFCSVSPKFHFIANANLQAETAKVLSAEDVVLYFSFSGAVRELMEMGKILEKSQAKLILVTRYPNSPGADYADLLLLCGVNESPHQQGSIAAKISQLFIVDVLFHEYCSKKAINH